jgi:hypothetical protein
MRRIVGKREAINDLLDCELGSGYGQRLHLVEPVGKPTNEQHNDYLDRRCIEHYGCGAVEQRHVCRDRRRTALPKL